MKSRILIIEDNAALSSSLKHVLETEGYSVETEAGAEQAMKRVTAEAFNVVVTDMQLPGVSGLDLISQLHKAKPHLPVILMTAHHTTDTAIEATKRGAFDYILKPFEPPELIDLIDKAITSVPPMAGTVELGGAPTAKDAIIGNSRAMQAVYKDIGRVADTPVTVLIRGETGTGKELVARAIHQHSQRADQPFIAVNCAAIPETLLESELFGHERGAFTGANFERIGRFEQAEHGTIFLDEIGDMSMSTQAKLLRVLQEKTIRRLGGKEVIPVNARVIAATHRELELALREKHFREDLYYRLNVAQISLPPLRERREDIPPLVRYFMQRHGSDFGFPNPSMSTEAFRFLQQQSWPGNVRELENAIRKALLLARGYVISEEHVRNALSTTNVSHAVAEQTLAAQVTELLSAAARGELDNVHATLNELVERELYSQAIRLAEGNQLKAARWLGVSRPTMREKLEHYGLRPGPHQSKE